MARLQIQVLGELAVTRDGERIALPASRKTRALLAYLALTGRPHRRDRLCELFWEVPDDPRGALRWSLSKLRPIANDEVERIVADRERVAFVATDAECDLGRIAGRLELPVLPREELAALAAALSEPLLDGIDLPDQQLFQRWLEAEREEARQLAARVEQRLAEHPDTPVAQALEHSRRWLELDPFSPAAATRLLGDLRRLDHSSEAAQLEAELERRFRHAGITWSPREQHPAAAEREQRGYKSRQSIRFCTAPDGARIAYATVGEGPLLVKAANWLSHLELDWDAPVWSPLFRELAAGHRLVRYDERGNGLSDWDVGEISFDAFVTDLETVADAQGLERFALLGISQGASVSIEYAVRHPERVSHLILFGGYAAGWRVDAAQDVIRQREAMMTLTETGWGQDNPVYRQIFSSTFMPSASAEELAWFNEFQRQTTSPANAARFQAAFGDIDVRERLAEVRVPTLVLHSRGDQRIPFDTGRDLAARIPDAEFVGLESDGHLLLGREAASREFVSAVRRFLAHTPPHAARRPQRSPARVRPPRMTGMRALQVPRRGCEMPEMPELVVDGTAA